MAQPANESSPASCLKDKLEQAEQKANEAEFHKQTAATLKDLITKSETELKTYQEAIPALVAKWKEQDDLFQELKKRLESCYPDWRCYLKKTVCEKVICEIWKAKKRYESKLGAPALRLEYATRDKDKSKKQIEAWKGITAWITKRLSDNKTLYDEICALDNCKYPLLQLYLFYFVLWPLHRQLCKSQYTLPPEEGFPEYGYCSNLDINQSEPSDASDQPADPDQTNSSNQAAQTGEQPPPDCEPAPSKTPDPCPVPRRECTCLVGYPWIIASEHYDCQLTRVWKAYSEAGLREAKAKSAFDQVEKDKTEYQQLATDESKRAKAAEALAWLDKLEPKPECPEPDPCEPPPEECPDPCEIDPCHLDADDENGSGNGSDDDPCGHGVPGICEELECEEPEPEPDPKDCEDENPVPPPEDPDCEEPEDPKDPKNTSGSQRKSTAPTKGGRASKGD